MGNKSNLPSQPLREKFLKILQASSDESSLQARLIDISSQKPSEEVILASILADDIRKALEFQSGQIKALINFIVQSLLTLSTQKRVLSAEEADYVIFCLRLVSRLITIIFEDKYETFCRQLFWEDNPNVSVQKGDEIEENLEEDPDQRKPKVSRGVIFIKANSLQIREDKRLWWPLGIKLMKAIANLLFYPGFTIPAEIDFNEIGKKEISKKFIGFPLPFNERLFWYPFESYFQMKPSKYLLENRLLMIKTLISLFSLPYFRNHSHLCQYNNPFLMFLTSALNPTLAEFFFSLLNFVAEYQENGTLPYIGWLVYDPLYMKTALMSSELLALLLEPNITFKEIDQNVRNSVELQEVVNYYLDLQPQDSVKIRENTASNQENSDYFKMCQDILGNFCYKIVWNINDQNYLRKLGQNLLKLLKGNSLEAKNTYLMFSMKEINFVEEVMVILWRMTQANGFFLGFLLEGHNKLDFLACLLTVMHEKFANSFQSGTFNLSITFLTQLSLLRDFASSLNTPLKQSFIFPSLPVISGTYADFLITVIHSGLMQCFEEKTPCLVSINLTAILLNVSPYVQNLTKSSGYKLVQMMQVFANVEGLLENKNNGSCLVKMMRVIDNILMHQGEKNINLMEVLWRKQSFFNKLEKLRITRKMIQFHQQNKGKSAANENAEKSDENQQLTEISKNSRPSPNKSQVSIRKEAEEEEKKINESDLEPPFEKKHDVSKNAIEEEKTEERGNERAILEWWEDVRKGFVMTNIHSVVKYLNMKLEGVSEGQIDRKIGELITNEGLIGIVAKKEQILGEAIVDFTIINKILHEFIWYLICVKNDALPLLDLNAWKLDTVNIKE